MNEKRDIRYPEEDLCKNNIKCTNMDYLEFQKQLMSLNKQSNTKKILENIDRTRKNFCNSCPATISWRYLKSKYNLP